MVLKKIKPDIREKGGGRGRGSKQEHSNQGGLTIEDSSQGGLTMLHQKDQLFRCQVLMNRKYMNRKEEEDLNRKTRIWGD